MRIGIDFDNTIACYDRVFYAAACERSMIPAELQTDKTSVRDYLRSSGREDDWTDLQGYVYGTRMELASLYPGVLDFVRTATRQKHVVSVISHRTKVPYRGPQFDLHAAARRFIEREGLAIIDGNKLDIFFELTQQDKIARIDAQRCDVFIDDLPEFLMQSIFPRGTRAILFDPAARFSSEDGEGIAIESYRSWTEIATVLLDDRSIV